MNSIQRLADGRRLDVLLTDDSLPLSRSQAARLIRAGNAQVDGVVVTKPSFISNIGALVVLTLPETEDSESKAENIPISIVYQDDSLAVVNKPAGMVVHPAAGNPDGTLVNALLYHLDSLSGISGQKRPGIVHRLDKDTSGLMLIAKNDQAHLALSRALANRTIEKYYLALVAGQMKNAFGSYDGAIARSPKDRKKMAVMSKGRDALTRWQIIEQREKSALVLIHLVTGRTHQIRVHFSHAHHPVLGDIIYGHKSLPPAPRLMLHAVSLAFVHPKTQETMRFFAPPEEAFDIKDVSIIQRAILNRNHIS
jgi:23S rRNA pseudouridine1911/1915/1917 synthase